MTDHECPFYATTQIGTERRPVGQRSATRSSSSICWCKHPKHSPVDEKFARGGGPGSGTALKCGGKMERCEIPPERYQDM